jgi:hypothetical protein
MYNRGTLAFEAGELGLAKRLQLLQMVGHHSSYVFSLHRFNDDFDYFGSREEFGCRSLAGHCLPSNLPRFR